MYLVPKLFKPFNKTTLAVKYIIDGILEET